MLRVLGSAAVALLTCTLTAATLFYGLNLAEAGNPDLGDIIGILTLYAGATSLGAATGVLFAAISWPGLSLLWVSLLSPLSAAIGFCSKFVVDAVADTAGLPRSLSVAVVVSTVSSFVLYSLLWRVTFRIRLRRAA